MWAPTYSLARTRPRPELDVWAAIQNLLTFLPAGNFLSTQIKNKNSQSGILKKYSQGAINAQNTQKCLFVNI